MSLKQFRAFSVILFLGTVMPKARTSIHAKSNLNPLCPSGFANFGDSTTDTGNLVDSFPFLADLEHPPYGETFFGKPAKRFSNGRLVPDFFALAFQKPLLDAYFSVTSFNFRNGINLATSGATAAFNPAAVTPFSVTPFQTTQFIRFQNSVAASQKQAGCRNFNLELPTLENPWCSWLYTINAGSNDIYRPVGNGTAFSFVNDTIVPQAVNAIAIAIVTSYQRGARQFLISGLSVAGCSTFILTYLRNANHPTNSLGCITGVNQISQNFNNQLFSQIKLLRLNLTGANIAYFDTYSAHLEILTHPAKYGFDPALTKTACCGAPGVGTLNYNPAITCGNPSLGSSKCSNPEQHIIWDGIHFTEAFYRINARFMLNGQYTDGGVNYTHLCNLDFSKWGSDITFQEAYPLQSVITYSLDRIVTGSKTHFLRKG